jgi:hypothetical protein
MTLLHPVQKKQHDKSGIRNFHNILAQLSVSAGTISKRRDNIKWISHPLYFHSRKLYLTDSLPKLTTVDLTIHT